MGGGPSRDEGLHQQLNQLMAVCAQQNAQINSILESMKEKKIDSFEDLQAQDAKAAQHLMELAKKAPALQMHGHNVGFFGDTSCGKSSTVNALLGKVVAEVGYGETTLDITPYAGIHQRLWDLPGRNDEINYLTLPYITCMKGLDQRVVMIAKTLKEMSKVIRLLATLSLSCIIVVNQVDLVDAHEREKFKTAIMKERDTISPGTRVFFISAKHPVMFKADWESFVHAVAPPIKPSQ